MDTTGGGEKSRMLILRTKPLAVMRATQPAYVPGPPCRARGSNETGGMP
jgi:hypothetical protein